MEKTALQIGPPPSPNRDKFPFVGTANIQGLRIDIENLAGSVREGTGPGGKKWQTKMRYHYGEIRKTDGVDGDKLDVYIGPNPQSKKVFIVHQNHPGSHPKAGQYDEDKAMLGFNSADEAKRGYLKQYDRKDFFRSITEMPMAQFKKSIFGENKGEKVAHWSDASRKAYDEEVKKERASGGASLADWERAFAASGETPTAFFRRLLTRGGGLSAQRLQKSAGLFGGVEPWSDEERRQMATASPEDVGRSFYTGAGAYQATGSSDDQAEYDRQRQAREYTWQQDPALQEKWRSFMEQNPGFRPHLVPKTAAEIIKDAACKTPGKKIRSGGQGRGMGVGQGKGPVGDTLSNKLRRFSKQRKKDKRPSTFIREKMKVGSLREAYELGAKIAIAAALMPEAPTVENSTPKAKPAPKFGVKMPSLPKGAPPPASSGASSGATES